MDNISAVAVGQLWAAIENPVNVLLMVACMITGFRRQPLKHVLIAAALFVAFEVTFVHLNGMSNDPIRLLVSHAWTKPLLAVTAWALGAFVAGHERKTKPET